MQVKPLIYAIPKDKLKNSYKRPFNVIIGSYMYPINTFIIINFEVAAINGIHESKFIRTNINECFFTPVNHFGRQSKNTKKATIYKEWRISRVYFNILFCLAFAP